MPSGTKPLPVPMSTKDTKDYSFTRDNELSPQLLSHGSSQNVCVWFLVTYSLYISLTASDLMTNPWWELTVAVLWAGPVNGFHCVSAVQHIYFDVLLLQSRLIAWASLCLLWHGYSMSMFFNLEVLHTHTHTQMTRIPRTRNKVHFDTVWIWYT